MTLRHDLGLPDVDTDPVLVIGAGPAGLAAHATWGAGACRGAGRRGGGGPKFSRLVGTAPNDEIAVLKDPDPSHPIPAQGDQLLLLEKPLLDPTTNQPVGNLLAHTTYMRILPGDDFLFLGTAEHRLNDGVISVQGSFRLKDTQAVFSIIGGTGTYRRARGTVTWHSPPGGPEKFTYDWN